ncbi:hypothetical protein T4B_880 [Trichinella pseudospiralis]|uniref:Uncharacterized protein n=1 Tax=Trichinella pseudospiralis TaxID=6337 RepID=A0A0V1GJP8_TRIPS|nr:hypothetical protein T4B_880 [Trichinella pseudospiralis]
MLNCSTFRWLDEMKVSLSWSEFKSNFQMVTTVNMEVPALCHL